MDRDKLEEAIARKMAERDKAHNEITSRLVDMVEQGLEAINCGYEAGDRWSKKARKLLWNIK